MPGIEMKRAFSALASPVRSPSPLGWAGMMGAFGAPRSSDGTPRDPLSPFRLSRFGLLSSLVIRHSDFSPATGSRFIQPTPHYLAPAPPTIPSTRPSSFHSV